MELRARENSPIGVDLTPSLPPAAAALHLPFLSSFCSSCFRPLPNYQATPPQNSCSPCNSVFYCSPRCLGSDSPLHSQSGECQLIRSHPATCHLSSELRLALRLRTLTLGRSSNRIGWLSCANLDAVLKEEGSEMGEAIREGAEVMRRVGGGEGREEEVMWAVMTNAVEVQVSGDGPVGVAVYGPLFSWFNHSCAPNACFRFELDGGGAGGSCFGAVDLGMVGVWPGSGEVEPGVWKPLLYHGINLTEGMSHYGPRVVVRSIKPIKKGEAVCIAYSDLLQPKAVRHFDLWSKYRFVCSCTRCIASPEMYVDYVLNSDGRILKSNHNNYSNVQCDELSDLLDQAIADYMSDGNPEKCYKTIEDILSETFQARPKMTFRLHPLNYLSINAYIALSSTCKVLSANCLATVSDEESTIKGFKISRASVAYSLLLAGATHQLFMFEPSFIASSAVFLVNAGRSIFGLLRSFCGVKFSYFPNFIKGEVSSVSLDEFKETSMRFLKCTSRNLTNSWPYLVRGLSYLENISSPTDFSWLGIANTCQIIDNQRSAKAFCFCYGSKIIIETHIEEYKSLAQLAICCLTYGRYLALICWGARCYLVDEATDIFTCIS